ncbi:hypothetical protein M316_0035 [Nitrincola phage 1M3-16]|uniref:hypothetical protein n=1 Tax=Nitrincola phage 1M3-16 TaxID=1472912 RepID=UPI000444ACDC|nr:hypothetical protein GJ22_gp117 [Nitrincola phage 1M3-16]AHX01100.1 hypothetical protein M316_0035 [Nitrincola phage 1M3-16]
MNLKKEIKEKIQGQWDNMLERGVNPYMTYHVEGADSIHIDLSLHSNKRTMWLEFSIHNTDCKPRFSGDVRRVSANVYKIYVDSYFEYLDYYIQMINQEIIEGLLIPNNLYV